MKYHRMMTKESTRQQMKLLDEASRIGDINKLKQLLEEDPSLLDRFDHYVPAREARDNPLHIAAWHGHIDFAAEVLRLMPQLAECVNMEGRLPLHLAAARGHIQVVEMLADRADQVLAWYGKEVLLSRDSKYGYMPAHIATINGKYDIVKILVERCKDVLDKTTDRKETLLHLAVISNCFDSVQYFINHGVNLNEQDGDGNTCLHLACKKKNHEVITYFLGQEHIEVINSTNKRGLTPLDVLLASSRDSADDHISLVNALRNAGGKEGNDNAKMNNEAQTLLIVATLVATMTFTAITNPPGGFVQLPYEMGYETNKTWATEWLQIKEYPVGKPVLLWELQPFFLLDTAALFSSMFVILSLLCEIPRTKIVMKFLAGVAWLAAFCTAIAFTYVYILVCVPDASLISLRAFIDGDDPQVQKNNKKKAENYKWVRGLLITWSVIYISLGLWGSFRVFMFVWSRGGFKRGPPNGWFKRVGWPKNGWFRKTASIIFFVTFFLLIGVPAYLFVYAYATTTWKRSAPFY